jgi:hypothetical protein
LTAGIGVSFVDRRNTNNPADVPVASLFVNGISRLFTDLRSGLTCVAAVDAAGGDGDQTIPGTLRERRARQKTSDSAPQVAHAPTED